MQKFSKVPLSSLCQDFVPLLPPKDNSLNFRNLVQSGKQIPTNKIIPTPKKIFRYLLTKNNFLKKKIFLSLPEKNKFYSKKLLLCTWKTNFLRLKKKFLILPWKRFLRLSKKHVFKTKMILIITGEKRVMLNTNYGEIFLPIL